MRRGIANQGSSSEVWCPTFLLGISHVGMEHSCADISCSVFSPFMGQTDRMWPFTINPIVSITSRWWGPRPLVKRKFYHAGYSNSLEGISGSWATTRSFLECASFEQVNSFTEQSNFSIRRCYIVNIMDVSRFSSRSRASPSFPHFLRKVEVRLC